MNCQQETGSAVHTGQKIPIYPHIRLAIFDDPTSEINVGPTPKKPNTKLRTLFDQTLTEIHKIRHLPIFTGNGRYPIYR